MNKRQKKILEEKINNIESLIEKMKKMKKENESLIEKIEKKLNSSRIN